METFGGLNLLDFTTGASGRLGFGRFGICDNERYIHSIRRQNSSLITYDTHTGLCIQWYNNILTTSKFN